MKRIFFIIICLIFTFSESFAQNVSFVYINGSNNNNKKMKSWFYEGVFKLHPRLVKKIAKDKKSTISPKNNYTINEKPVIFFWGDKSREDLEYVESQLDISNAVSSLGATIARTLITQYMHDAIWVQKSHNMLPILDELNETVKKEWQKGNKVILMGYSAGSFINMEYLLNKIAFIDIYEVLKDLDIQDELTEYVKNNPKNKTCISALRYGEIGIVSSSGHITLNQNQKDLLQNYDKLDEATEKYCSPQGAVLGTISFANPLVLFYSDLADPSYEINFYQKYIIKHIIENGMFMVTINFREDPLGLPVTQNLTTEEIEDVLETKLQDPKGFIYNDSSIWSGRPFFMAHTAYWSASRIFSSAIINKLTEGYRFEYDPKFQKKMLKKRGKITF